MYGSHDPSTLDEGRLLLRQYQLVLESADRYDERRLTVDKFFTTVILTLFLLGGSLSIFPTLPNSLLFSAVGNIVILATISALCIAWLEHVRRSYIGSLVKRYIVRRLEQSELYPLPHRPFLVEYNNWRSHNLSKGYLIRSSKGRLRRLAAISTMWPYILGLVSLAFIALVYFFVIEPSLTACGTACRNVYDARVFFQTWLVFVVFAFFVSLYLNVVKQSDMVRYLDEEPDGALV